MKRLSPVLWLLCALSWLAAGCRTAKPMYLGPRRPPAEIATVEGRNTVILEIDRRPVYGSAFELLPGVHALLVQFSQPGIAQLSDDDSNRKGSVWVCFTAQPGRSYAVIPAPLGDRHWRPELVDQETTYRITTRYAQPFTPTCRGEREPPPPVPPPPEQPEADVEPEAPAEPAVPAEPAAPAVQVFDNERPPPRRQTRPAPAYSPTGTSALLPTEVRPGTGIGLETGLFFGGDELVRAQSGDGETTKLTAGEGFLLSVGAMTTPVWSSGSVGLGVGFNAGVKVASLGGANGNVTFVRFPLSMMIHAMLPVSPRWFIVPRLGFGGDLGANLSGEGVGAGIDADLSSGVGLQLEMGGYHSVGERGAIAFGARIIILSYGLGGGQASQPRIDGTSVGLTAAWYFNL